MLKWMSLWMVAGLLLVGCTTDDRDIIPTQAIVDPTPALTVVATAAQRAGEPTRSAASTPTVAWVAGSPGSEYDQALTGAFKGTRVSLAGSITDGDLVKFENSIQAFETSTGIDIQYSSSKDFDLTIAARVAGGSAPDIADFSQLGLLGSLAAQGRVVDLNPIIRPDFLNANYKQSWLDMATLRAPGGSIMAGVWNRVNARSLVWYPKKEFDLAGYAVPATWDELLRLMEQIKQNGGTPWCVGIESDAASGWVAADWVADILLRSTSARNYDRWVAGDLKFSSPEVTNALQYLAEIWLGSGNVYGGRQAIAATSFLDAPKPMFEKPNRCWLHRQDSFITLVFPKDARMGVDYDFFYLPPMDAAFGRPLLVSGDIYAMFNDRPEVRAVMQWFATANSVEGWVRVGGAISPHNDARLEWYTGALERKIAEIIWNADTVRCTGSDQMPAAVGAGAFWKQMTAYVSGSVEMPAALKAIDDAWPKK